MFYFYKLLLNVSKKNTIIIWIMGFSLLAPAAGSAQVIKILFDATKAETAGNADWVIDSDLFNLGFGTGPAVPGGGNESNPQRIPTPAQSGITAATAETYWTGALSAWGVDCVKKGYTVETLPYNGVISYGNVANPEDLTHYKVFIVCEPNIVFTAVEKTALLNFVFNGGGLFMVSDHTVSDRNNDGWDSPAIWNDFFTNNGSVSNPFGISFDLANFSETSTNIPILAGDPLLHGPMGNVTQVKWSNGTSITINTTKNSSAKGVVYKTGSAFGSTGIMCAYAKYGTGKVVALGDSSPCDDGTGDPGDGLFNGYFTDAAGNHQRLIMNATIWLATPSGVVPVEFISVSGIASGKNDLISWEANETGTGIIYNIQRSENGRDFYTVGTTAGHGNTPHASYSYTDNTIQASPEFYRVSSTDNTGRSLSSSVISIRSAEDISLKLYPNPAEDRLQVDHDKIPAGAAWQITDISGRIVFVETVTNSSFHTTIPVKNLFPGKYTLRLIKNNSIIVSGSFIRACNK